MEVILQIKDLYVDFFDKNTAKNHSVIKGLCFDIAAGKKTILFGPSGCGKSILAESIIGIVTGFPGIVSGQIIYNGFSYLPPKYFTQGKSIKENPEFYYNLNENLRRLRGKKISYVFQEYKKSLFVSQKVLHQFINLYLLYKDDTPSAENINRFFKDLNLKIDYHSLENKYADEISGGMAQQLALAMALLPEPQLLIADEVVTSMDLNASLNIIESLNKYFSKEEQNTEKPNRSLILITHDKSLIDLIEPDYIAIMFNGLIIESIPYSKNLTFYHPISRLIYDGCYISECGNPNDDQQNLCPCLFICDQADNCRLPFVNKISDEHFIRCEKPSFKTHTL